MVYKRIKMVKNKDEKKNKKLHWHAIKKNNKNTWGGGGEHQRAIPHDHADRTTLIPNVEKIKKRAIQDVAAKAGEAPSVGGKKRN